MQRRVWIETAQSIIYPNLYILLVSPPGVGKSQAISRTGKFWLAVKDLHVAPDSVTRASLIDAIDAAQTKAILPDGSFLQYNALAVPASEFGVLVPAHDLEFLNTLNHIYDNPDSYRETRRSRSKQVDIPFPMLNILAGTQPAYLSELLPESAWGMGFTSRLIMVYSATATPVNLFDSKPIDEPLRKSLSDDLTTMCKLYGGMRWTPEAKEMMTVWAGTNFAPIPTHSRLLHYVPRRLMSVMKLTTISALSRANDLTIVPDDVERARDWLIEAENLMPDIFRDMNGKSDKVIIDDLYDYLWRLYSRETPPKPIHESKILEYLKNKVPGDKVVRMMELCERAGIIERDAGTKFYRPGRGDQVRGIE